VSYPFPIDSSTGLHPEVRGRANHLFARGSDLYAVGSSAASTWHANTTLRVYKSTDNGETWTAQDNADAPVAGYPPSGFDHGYPSCITARRKTADVLVVAYVDASSNLAFCEFDMGTDSWGTPVTGGPRAYGEEYCDTSSLWNGVLAIPCWRASDSSYWFLYAGRTSLVSGNNLIYTDAVKWTSGGGWGTPLEVAGSLSGYEYSPRDLIYDATSGRVHAFMLYVEPGSPDVRKAYHRSIKTDDSFGALSVCVPSQTGEKLVSSDWYTSVICQGLIFGGKIILPVLMETTNNYGSERRSTPAIYVAAEAEDPTWTRYEATTDIAHQYTPGSSLITGGFQVVDAGSSRLFALWSNLSTYVNGTDTGQMQLEQAVFDLSGLAWESPSAAFDGSGYAFPNWGESICAALGGDGNVYAAATNQYISPNEDALAVWQFPAGTTSLMDFSATNEQWNMEWLA
jgi:hypothetical protein